MDGLGRSLNFPNSRRRYPAHPEPRVVRREDKTIDTDVHTCALPETFVIPEMIHPRGSKPGLQRA